MVYTNRPWIPSVTHISARGNYLVIHPSWTCLTSKNGKGGPLLWGLQHAQAWLARTQRAPGPSSLWHLTQSLHAFRRDMTMERETGGSLIFPSESSPWQLYLWSITTKCSCSKKRNIKEILDILGIPYPKVTLGITRKLQGWKRGSNCCNREVGDYEKEILWSSAML